MSRRKNKRNYFVRPSTLAFAFLMIISSWQLIAADGIRKTELGIGLDYKIGSYWHLQAGIGWTHILGDAKRSPVREKDSFAPLITGIFTLFK